MKNLIKMLLVAALAMSLAACGSSGSTGSSVGGVKFGMEIPAVDGNVLFSTADGTGGKNFTDGVPAKVKLSYYHVDSPETIVPVVFDLSEVSTGKYFTDDILKLAPGNYKISVFQVVNAADSVIYMTPKAGSELAVSTITTALDHDFTVSSDETNNITMDVVKVLEDHTPEDYGYTAYTFRLIDYNTFFIKITALTDTGWADATADLVVRNNDDDSIVKDDIALTDTLNKIIVSVCDNYKLSISKDTYTAQDTVVTEAELQGFYITPLVIRLKKAE